MDCSQIIYQFHFAFQTGQIPDIQFIDRILCRMTNGNRNPVQYSCNTLWSLLHIFMWCSYYATHYLVNSVSSVHWDDVTYHSYSVLIQIVYFFNFKIEYLSTVYSCHPLVMSGWNQCTMTHQHRHLLVFHYWRWSLIQ